MNQLSAWVIINQSIVQQWSPVTNSHRSSKTLQTYWTLIQSQNKVPINKNKAKLSNHLIRVCHLMRGWTSPSISRSRLSLNSRRKVIPQAKSVAATGAARASKAGNTAISICQITFNCKLSWFCYWKIGYFCFINISNNCLPQCQPSTTSNSKRRYANYNQRWKS